MRGRPYGGCAILWKASLHNAITILELDEVNGRYITISLNIMQASILLTNVYFPYYSRHNAYSYDVSLITSYIESVCIRYSSMKYVIAGDFNFECTAVSSGYHMCSELFSNNNLFVVIICLLIEPLNIDIFMRV